MHKRLELLGAILLALVVLALVFILGAGWFIAPQDKLEKADAIVVVSGGDTNKRTDEGVDLWKRGYAPKLFFSGAAADNGTSNAAVMRQRASNAGVPADATIIEEKSRTTRENAENLVTLFQAQGIKKAILVSSPYHTRRVKITFQKVFGKGYIFTVHPAKDSRWAKSGWWKQPDTFYLTMSELWKTLYVATVGPLVESYNDPKNP